MKVAQRFRWSEHRAKHERLTNESWSTYIAGAALGMLRWFTFASAKNRWASRRHMKPLLFIVAIATTFALFGSGGPT